MQNIINSLQGKRTYIGIVASVLFYSMQVSGNANWVSEAELNQILNIAVQLILAVYTAYARFLATRG